MKTILPTLRLFLLLTLLTGVLYPLAVTAFAHLAFRSQAEGSLLHGADGQVVGSALLAQKTESARYFWPRPSAGDYATVASGASNLGPTSETLRAAVAKRAEHLRATHGLAADAPVPADLLFASGSGLDPHLSPAAARFQTARVAQTRRLTTDAVQALVTKHTAAGGLLGEDRVNVLALNLALDALR